MNTVAIIKNRPDLKIYCNKIRRLRIDAHAIIDSNNYVTVLAGSTHIDINTGKVIKLDSDVTFSSLERATKFIAGKIDAAGVKQDLVGKVQGFDSWCLEGTTKTIGQYLYGNYRCTLNGAVNARFECSEAHDIWCKSQGLWYKFYVDTDGSDCMEYYKPSICRDRKSLFSDDLIKSIIQDVKDFKINLMLGPKGCGKTELALKIPVMINGEGTLEEWADVIRHNEVDLRSCSKLIDSRIEKARKDQNHMYFTIFDDGPKADYFEQMLGVTYNLDNESYREYNNIPENYAVIITGNDIIDGNSSVVANNLNQSNLSRFNVIRCSIQMNSDKVINRFVEVFEVSEDKAKDFLDCINDINTKLDNYKFKYSGQTAQAYNIGLREVFISKKLEVMIRRMKGFIQEAYDGKGFGGDSDIINLVTPELNKLEELINRLGE